MKVSHFRSRFSALPSEMQSAIAATRTAFIAVAAASALINLLMLVGPIFMLQVYDRVLPSRSVSTLAGLFLIEADNLDEALAIAEELLQETRPGTAIEVRPILDGRFRGA